MIPKISFFSLIVFLLSCALFLFQQPQAEALPSTPTISYGQNPIVTIGGSVADGENTTIFTAPTDHDIIVTDLILTSFKSNMGCKASHKSELVLSSGEILGHFETETGFYNGTHGGSSGFGIQHNFQSGLRIPAGETLSLFVTQSNSYGGSCSPSGIRYMISGYYAQK